MSCDCSRLAYGALLMLPLECKTILGPFNREFVLTDVIFDLYTHPNGDASKACGFVWNVLPNQWSRLLMGDTIGVPGRRYSLESGILCPRNSYLTICSCYFVSEPTALFSARVTGCFCDKGHEAIVDPGPFHRVTWTEGPSDALDPRDPTTSATEREQATSFVIREALGTASDAVGPRDTLLLRGDEAEVMLRPGEAAAVPVSGNTWRWSSAGSRERTGRAPKGTTLVAARRSPDGRLVQWAMYRESALPAAHGRRTD
jgi:hypothetical protein